MKHGMIELYDLITNYEPENDQEINDKRIMLKYIQKFNDSLSRDNEMFHFTTSGWIVNEDRTKVLMVYHNIYNSWAWVGGHADGNANLLEVVKKEIFEETGIKNIKLLDNNIFGLSIQSTKPHIKNGKYVSSHLHYDIQFLFEASEQEILKINPKENSNVSWLKVEDLLDNINQEYMKPLYEKLIKKVERYKI